MDNGWYVLTPAGKAGPYNGRADAKAAAEPFGWIVLAPATWPATTKACDHAVDNPNCQHYS
jgi:hypothetical protein